MAIPNDFKEWAEKVTGLSRKLVEREDLLRQYEMWLEASETTPTFYGKDVKDMLLGTILGFLDKGELNFIPGIDDLNFISVLARAQKLSGLDLGLCQYFINYTDEIKLAEYERTRAPMHNFSLCGAAENMSISSPGMTCLPPYRCECPYRNAKLEEKTLKIGE